jgi:hypothetical protein
MKLNITGKNTKLFIPLIIIILFFRMPADNNYTNPKLFLDIAKITWEINTYPSLQYEKQLQSTMLVEITGLSQKRKGV